MTRVVSEDSVRRGLDKIDAESGARWLTSHLDETVRPLLSEPWVLDVDTTVKPLYDHQEGAEVGYNPRKPGRPSHAYHSMMIGGVRLILDVGVEPGDRPSSKHSEPYLWDRLDHLPRPLWPALVRGDKDWGNQRNMARCEREGVHYLFKQRLTKGVRRVVEKAMAKDGWEDAGQGWSGKESELRLEGWSRQRRAILLRRRLPECSAACNFDPCRADIGVQIDPSSAWIQNLSRCQGHWEETGDDHRGDNWTGPPGPFCPAKEHQGDCA